MAEKLPKILFIDDDVPTATSVKAFLEGENFDVVVAFSGLEGIEKIYNFRPDIVLLDIMMPGMDGLEVCRSLKAHPTTADLPIVFLSAKAQDNDIKTGLAQGAEEYITKPFDPNDLVKRLRKILQKREIPIDTSVGEISGELKDFITNFVNSFIKWDLVEFFQKNPYTQDSVEGIARYIGRDVKEVEEGIKDLVQSGFLMIIKGKETAIYRYTNDSKLRKLVDDFISFSQTRSGRLKVIYHIISLKEKYL